MTGGPTGGPDGALPGALPERCPSIDELEHEFEAVTLELDTGSTPARRDVIDHVARCEPCRIVVELLAGRRRGRAAGQDCATFEALLAARTTVGLHAADDALLDRHLAACEACRDVSTTLADVPSLPDDGDLPVVPREQYVIGRELARGGMGRIMTARDRRIGRPVAVKELLDSGPRAAARFEREARVTARLQHPGIVPIYEIGRWPNGKPFYSMRMVPGRPLRDAIAETRSLAERLTLLPVVVAVAEAIAYAHAHRIIHRDLTPSNVLVGAYGETVVIDWGLAKDLSSSEADVADAGSSSGDGKLTIAGAIVGTAAYMPPEQAAGDPVDERADVYALGAILYHVLAGAPPYQGTTSQEILDELRSRPPAPLDVSRPWRFRRVEARVTEDLRTIVGKAMARDPAARYATAGELVAELKRYLAGEMVRAHGYSMVARVRRWAARRRGVLVVIGVLLACVLIGATAAFTSIVRERNRADDQRLVAERQRNVMRRTYATLLEEQGRLELLGGSPARALAYLSEARREGNDSMAGRFLVAAAARDLEALRLSLSHPDEVESVSYSPDGTRVLACSGDTVTVWDLATGTAPLALIGHAARVDGASYSADGALILSWSEDHTAKLWDARTGSLVRSFAGHTRELDGAELDRGGQLLLTTARDGKACLWDATTGAQLRCLAIAADGEIVHGQFDPRRPARSKPCGSDGDGSCGAARLLTWSHDTVTVWNVRTGAALATLVGHGARILHAEWSYDGTRIVTAGLDATARIWDPDDGHLHATLSGHSAWVGHARFSPDARRVVTVSFDKTAKLWEAANGALIAQLPHAGAVFDAAFSPDGRTIVTGSGDRTARLWNGRDGAPLATYEGHVGWVNHVAFSPDGAWIATASNDRTLKVWNARAHALRTALVGHRRPIARAGLDASGARLFTYAEGEGARMWDLASGAKLHASDELPGEVGIGPEPFSPDGTLVVTAAIDGSAPVREVATGRLRFALPGDGTVLHGASFSPDGARILTTTDRGPPRLWDARTGALVGSLAGHEGDVNALFASAAPRLIVSARQGPPQVWNTLTGERIAVLRRTGVGLAQVAISPDGRRAATVGVPGTTQHPIQVWRVEDAVVERELGEGVTPWFSHDGTRLVTASMDGTARIWDLETGRLLGAVHSDLSGLSSAQLSPDGMFLVTAGFDYAAKIWDWRTGKLLAVFRGETAEGASTSRGWELPGWHAFFTLNGRQVITAGPGPTAHVWEAGTDGQDAAALVDLVRRRVPWRVREGRLVSATP